MILEKALESSLDSKEIKPVNPKGHQPCIFIGRTDAEAEAAILGPPDVKSLLIEKGLMLGKIEDKRKGQLRMRRLDSITSSIDMNYSKLQEFPGGSERKESACNVGEPGLVPGLGRSPGERYIAIHFSILAWKIPWMENSGKIQSKGSQRVRHD